METNVRDCRADDVAVIAVEEPPGQEFAATMFARQESGDCHFLTAWRGAIPLGSAELTRTDPRELRNFNVGSTFRGQGVGGDLIRAAEARVGEIGTLRIAVATDNPRAADLYRRLGYEGTGTMSTYAYDFIDVDGSRKSAIETTESLLKTW